MSIVAQAATHTVYVYRSPRAKKPFTQFTSPNADGSPVVFLVKSRAPGWEQVRLPVRPDGSTGWVRDRALSLALDPYRVKVSLSAHSLTVWNGAKVIQSEPAGVGRAVLPTPGGTYYLVELLKQPDPNGVYGPYAFGLSAYSNVLFSFGGGPGQIGLHGTDDPSALGTNVSHGCIRISNAGITRLAALLPLGTPVEITK
jgi:lipoprotein-anchoring transpeptidase ErfK/SrfK